MTSGSIFARPAHVLTGKNLISICLPNNPTLDAVAAGTALYMGLSSLGKSVGLACDHPINPDFNLLHQDKSHNALIADGNNLVVSFPYQEGSVDKVTYSIDSDTFNLIIQPREGSARLDPNKVNFSYSGGKPEVIITLYAPTLNSLGKLYTAYADQFTGVDIINIDRHFTNGNYGTINVVDKKSPSMSEMALALLTELKVAIDKDIATNLYAGIAAATNNFTAHSVSAETFESIALLLKSGAVKKPAFALNRQMGPMNTIPNISGIGQQPFQPQLGSQPQFGQGIQNQASGNLYGQQMNRPQMNQPYINQPQQFNQYQQYQQPPIQMPIQNSFSGSLGEEQGETDDAPVMAGAPAEFSEIPGSSQKTETSQPEQLESPSGMTAEPEIEFVENKEINPQEVNDDSTAPNTQQQPQQKTPKDWLKPKIFKGTNLV